MIALLILFWLFCGVVAAGWYEADCGYENYIPPYLSTLLGAVFLFVMVIVRVCRAEAWGWEWPYESPKFKGGWFKDKNNHHEGHY
jgi:hypothetical protein